MEDVNTEADKMVEEVSPEVDSGERAEYRTLANGTLSPRHRRLAQLAAEGKSSADIGRELGYSASRVSVLLNNSYIVDEITRLRERIFEETIESRLKSFSESALNNIQAILNDRTNRVKVSEKMALSQWLIEMLNGKATQKIESGHNLLITIMDRLDARRHDVRNVQPATADIEVKALPEAPAAEEDQFAAWAKDFGSAST